MRPQSMRSEISAKQAAAFKTIFIHYDLLGFTNSVLVQLLCHLEISLPFLVIYIFVVLSVLLKKNLKVKFSVQTKEHWEGV